MKVGIDASNLIAGGGVTHLAELLSSADPAQDGFSSVTVWGRRETLRTLPERDWLHRRMVPALEGGLPRRTAWRIWHLDSVVRAEGCDVLFVPGGSYSGTFRPMVTMSRNLLPFDAVASARYGWSLMRLKLLALRYVQARTFRRATGVIVLTRFAESTVRRAVPDLTGPVTTIPHGVSASLFREVPAQLEASAYSFDRPFVFLYVSKVDVYKHQVSVAEAVLRMRADGSPVALDLVGPSYEPELRRLQRFLGACGDPDAIRYHPAVAQSKLRDIYFAADGFVFASSCENMPNILVEAMATGLPIASSSHSVMPEVLGDAGVYFDPERPSTIRSALQSLFDSPERRYAMATLAVATARQLSWDRCARDTFAFLRRCSSSRPSATELVEPYKRSSACADTKAYAGG